MPSAIQQFLEHVATKGTIPPEAVRRYQAASNDTLLSFDQIIVELGILREIDLAGELGSFLEIPISRPADIAIDHDLSSQLGLAFCEQWAVLPALVEDDTLLVLASNPFDKERLDMVAYFFDKPISIRVCARSDIAAYVSSRRAALHPTDETAPNRGDFDGDFERLKDLALDAPVVTFVSRIAQEAVQADASDIHIEPFDNGVRVRFRRDGMLTLQENAPRSMLTGIVTRIKILSHLNIVERRKPQDGRMRLSVRGQEVDFRVSVMPTIHGESIVMRLLVGRAGSFDLTELGFDITAIGELSRLSESSNGIVAITGPTGSGKTTTLYSLVAQLDRQRMKIFTIEDPVEYRLEGITQLQVDTSIGLDFATALRSVLRQDPDVILVGEIRDRETAQIAVQAALTGHLVLTTLHTNSAAGALTRLRDMGIEPFLIGATIRGAIAQRLVRKICPTCRGSNPHCETCGGAGTSGRTVIYEILRISSTTSDNITAGQSEAIIQQGAVEEGMVTLKACGERLVADGHISASELARTLGMEA